MSDYQSDLHLALRLADLADKITLDRYQSLDLEIEKKPDLSPVTDADRAVERALIKEIALACPKDGVIGEEFGQSGGTSGRSWVIDPIDATKNFVRGVPVWGTLIALMDGEDVKVGVVSAPAMARRWFAHEGGGAFTIDVNGDTRQIRVSKVGQISDASISFSGLRGWRLVGLAEKFANLAEACWRQRAYGDFWSHLLVAEGAVDIATEPELNLWDMAPLDIIVREAGGRFTSIAGIDGPHGGNVITSNGLLHQEVIDALN
ncbi:MAG TPA: histidinol-phosphatase [Candidatus Nanopelagicaceae bacterium]|nr:histidinol-phosphatase [Candidatus Nanopelagicaceae bacterium]